MKRHTVAATAILFAFTGCAANTPSPTRFDAIYQDVTTAMAQWDPGTTITDTADLQASLGLNASDGYAVVGYHFDETDESATVCIENAFTYTYFYLTPDADLLIGDGHCSKNEDDAVVMYDGVTNAIIKGTDVAPLAVQTTFLHTAALDASIKNDIKKAAQAAETFAAEYPQAQGFFSNNARVGPNYNHLDQPSIMQHPIYASPGNNIDITGTPNGYCIRGFNELAATAASSTTALLYDPTQGGLTQAPCSLLGDLTWTRIS